MQVHEHAAPKTARTTHLHAGSCPSVPYTCVTAALPGVMQTDTPMQARAAARDLATGQTATPCT